MSIYFFHLIYGNNDMRIAPFDARARWVHGWFLAHRLEPFPMPALRTDKDAFLRFLVFYIPPSTLVFYIFVIICHLSPWASIPLGLLFTPLPVFLETVYNRSKLVWNQLQLQNQRTLKRWIRQQLSTLGLLVPHEPPRLPPELWIIIFEYAFPPPMAYRTTCDPEDFPEFASALINDGYSAPCGLDRSAVLLKRVCREWNAILGTQTKSYLILYAPDLAQLPKKYHKVSKKSERYLVKNACWIDPEEAFDTSADNLSILQISPGSPSDVPSEEDLEMDILSIGNYSDGLGEIRSLIYDGGDARAPEIFLDIVSRSFSHLTTLALQFNSLTGILVLEKLENLYVNVAEWDPSCWWFPSLRQLALGDRCANFQYFGSWVPCPPISLESLIVPRRGIGHLTADASFWRNRPSLQSLSVHYSAFRLTHYPPPEHPLAYLHFVGSRIIENGLASTSVILDAIPNLKKVRLPVQDWRDCYPDSVNAERWSGIVNSQREKGLQLIDEKGNIFKHHEAKKDTDPWSSDISMASFVWMIMALWCWLGMPGYRTPPIIAAPPPIIPPTRTTPPFPLPNSRPTGDFGLSLELMYDWVG